MNILFDFIVPTLGCIGLSYFWFGVLHVLCFLLGNLSDKINGSKFDWDLYLPRKERTWMIE
jgi:hypothetical protein